MKIDVLNKYHSITIFFLSSVLWITNLNLSYNFTSLICFFLIATIGVSHGALDNLKGAELLKRLSIKKDSLLGIEMVKVKSKHSFTFHFISIDGAIISINSVVFKNHLSMFL